MTVFAPSRDIEILRLEDIPPGTTKIDLRNCRYLIELPENLPEGITEIDFSGCESLEELPNLPESLTKLIARSCLKLAILPDLPKGLTELAISGCESLEEFPELPQGLIKLIANGFSNLERLHDLPKGLTELDISLCNSLEELPNLPESLTQLSARSCSKLARLPENFPANLTYLDLSGCTKLPNSPALIAQLCELENRNRDNPNFRLIWPEHLDQSAGIATEVKKLITDAYKEYYLTDPNFMNREPNATDGANYPTLKLFHRFLSEAVGVRGGPKEIAESAYITAQKISQNPQFLKFIDEASKTYLDACVNQPVAGFTEISMMVDIATQRDIPSKLEAARMLMSVDVIRQETRNLIGNAINVEVELANLLLLEVCKELGVEWPGVPQRIAFERTIRDRLNPEKINFVAGEVRKVLNMPSEEVVEYMCEHSKQDFWANITLTEEEKDEINQPLKILQERFLEEEDPSEIASLGTKIKDSETACRKAILEASKEKTLRILRAPLIEEIQEKEEFAEPQPTAQNPAASQFAEHTTRPFQRNL